MKDEKKSPIGERLLTPPKPRSSAIDRECKPKKSSKKLLGLVIAFILNFLFFLSHHVVSIFPAYLSAVEAPKTYIGLFMNTPALMLCLYVITMGSYYQQFSKKKILICVYSILFITNILMYYSYDNLLILFFLKLLASIPFALSFTILINLAHEFIPDNRRIALLAIFGLSGLLSTPIASLLGEHIAANNGYQYLFLAVSGFSLLLICVSFFLYEPVSKLPVKQSYSFWHIIRKKRYLSINLLNLIFGGLFGILVTFIPVFTEMKLGQSNISGFFIAFSAISIILRFLAYIFIDRVSKKHLFLTSFGCGLIAIVFILFLNSYYILYLVGSFYGICHTILFPTLSAAYIHQSEEAEKTIATNVFLSVNMFGMIFWSSLLGFFGDLFGLSFIFMAMIVVIVAAIGISWYYQE